MHFPGSPTQCVLSWENEGPIPGELRFWGRLWQQISLKVEKGAHNWYRQHVNTSLPNLDVIQIFLVYGTQTQTDFDIWFLQEKSNLQILMLFTRGWHFVLRPIIFLVHHTGTDCRLIINPWVTRFSQFHTIHFWNLHLSFIGANNIYRFCLSMFSHFQSGPSLGSTLQLNNHHKMLHKIIFLNKAKSSKLSCSE